MAHEERRGPRARRRGHPGVCDAVVQLYDGHGGKHAARHRILEMPAVVEECFFNFRDTRKYIDDRETLYGKVDDTGFHPRLDDAIVAAFERLDREVKAEDRLGPTAAVIFLRKGAANVPGFAAGDVIVKCAWVGDSRAVMFRDGELSSLVDLSRDHKPVRQRGGNAFEDCTTNWRATARSWTKTRRSTLPSAVEGRTNKRREEAARPGPRRRPRRTARAPGTSRQEERGIRRARTNAGAWWWRTDCRRLR